MSEATPTLPESELQPARFRTHIPAHLRVRCFGPSSRAAGTASAACRTSCRSACPARARTVATSDRSSDGALVEEPCVRYCQQDRCPDWKPGQRRRTELDAFTNRIEQWIAAGGRNAAELFRELQAQGCVAGYDAVRRLCQPPSGQPAPAWPTQGSLRAGTTSTSFGTAVVIRVAQACREASRRGAGPRGPTAAWPALREALDLAESFAALVRKQATLSFSDWLVQVEQSGMRGVGRIGSGSAAG